MREKEGGRVVLLLDLPMMVVRFVDLFFSTLNWKNKTKKIITRKT